MHPYTLLGKRASSPQNRLPPLGKRASSPRNRLPPLGPRAYWLPLLGPRASSPRNWLPLLGPRASSPRNWLALALLLPSTLALAQNPPPDTSAQEPNPSAVLQRFFHEIQHLQADFIQLEFDYDGVFQRESTGRLYLSRPGRFRLDYLEPDKVMIWADGENLSMFDPELEQVTVWKQAKRLKESAAALLAGEAADLENYQVNAAEFEDGLQWFDLTGASAEEGNVRLALRDNVPAIIEYSDELGSRVQMRLYQLDLKSEIDDKLFDPEIPPGVDIFEAMES